MIDLPGGFDIIAFFERETELSTRASKLERHGRCPWCGGTDRFLVSARYNLWRCRQECPESGCHDSRWEDVASYVMRRYDKDFVAAKEHIGCLPPFTPRPREDRTLSSDLATAMLHVVEACQDQLRTHPMWAQSLTAWRGLSPETMQAFGIGCATAATPGTVDGLRVPAGVTIPLIDASGFLRGVKVRSPRGSTDKAKYRCVRGTVGGHLFGKAREGETVAVITEGEFDAMLAWQETGLDSYTAGSAQASFLPSWVWQFMRYERVLVVVDKDKAGAAQSTWKALGQRAVFASVPHGKDLSEFHLGGGDVCSWVMEQLRGRPLPELAVPRWEPPTGAPVIKKTPEEVHVEQCWGNLGYGDPERIFPPVSSDFLAAVQGQIDALGRHIVQDELAAGDGLVCRPLFG